MCLVLVGNCLLAAWENGRARELDSALLRADARYTAGDIATTVVVYATALRRSRDELDLVAGEGIGLERRTGET